MALDTIRGKPVKGIPTSWIHPMEHAHIDRLAGAAPGSYRREPETAYLAMQRAVGSTLIDQYIPDNPLSMGDQGFESPHRGPTTGANEVVCDGMSIRSPDDVVEHLETFVFPSLRKEIERFDAEQRARDIIEGEIVLQERMGPEFLKGGHAFIGFPCFRYGEYGYANYFMAYALYPEVIERDFSLQADRALLNNRAAARAYTEGNLPPIYRLDFDMADSRGTLASVESLDRLWLPHFARALEPLTKTSVKMIWHCDGNLMEMVPRLLDCGLRGFQGFQYECGMDYPKICSLKTKDGEDLMIWAGVSVTDVLPYGTPGDVRRHMAWLVEHGPRDSLFLQCSSSIAPGVPWENMQALVDGLAHYREHGRETA